MQAAEERNPIYNPTNPTEEIYPIENTGTPEKMEETNESTITSETQAEESSEDVSKKEVTTNNPKTNEERPSSKKSQHQVFFTDELFDASHITIVPKHFLLEFHTGISRNGYLWEKELINDEL